MARKSKTPSAINRRPSAKGPRSPVAGLRQRSAGAGGRSGEAGRPTADGANVGLLKLDGKVAVVTGASRGIGEAIAWKLASAGCTVIVTSRKLEAASSVAGGMVAAGLRAQSAALDVADETSVRALFQMVCREFGRLDVLINNAGIAHKLAPVQDLDPKVWRDVIDTNLHGLFLCTHYALPLMPAGSTIVNNLSVAAQGSFPGHSGYNSAKWGGLGFTNTLREELRERRIRVVALLPGPTDTDIWEQFMPEAAHSSKMMTPEAVAQAVVDCLSLPVNAVVEEIRLRPIGGTI